MDIKIPTLVGLFADMNIETPQCLTHKMEMEDTAPVTKQQGTQCWSPKKCFFQRKTKSVFPKKVILGAVSQRWSEILEDMVCLQHGGNNSLESEKDIKTVLYFKANFLEQFIVWINVLWGQILEGKWISLSQNHMRKGMLLKSRELDYVI